MKLTNPDVRRWLRRILSDPASTSDVKKVACAMAIIANDQNPTSIEGELKFTATERQIRRQIKRLSRYGFQKFLFESRVY